MNETDNSLDYLSDRILKAAFRVHSSLGPGLLESAYQACLLHELRKAGLHAEAQVVLPITYDNVIVVESVYRIDILVEGLIILELKAIDAILPVHKAQLLSYLKLSKLRLGLLLNFHVPSLREGITRIINGY